MAHSRKRFPGYSDSEGKKIKAYYLRIMNRRIRRLDVSQEDSWIPDGNKYRKFVNVYDFRDYNFRYYSERELKDSCYEENELYRMRGK